MWLSFFGLAIILMSVGVAATPAFYCSSMCADTTSACFGPSASDCYACDPRMFILNSDGGVCELKGQNRVVAHELRHDDMNISGFVTSRPNPTTCGAYGLSGRYVHGDFIGKRFQFDGLGAHYGLVIKFVVGYIGAWSQSDSMLANIEGVSYSWNYHCSQKSNLCSGSGVDCLTSRSFEIEHSETTLALNISSSLSSTDPTTQFWGLRELVVVAKMCSEGCAACFGPLSTECLACDGGRFLLGNVCVRKCPNLHVSDMGECTKSCPAGYYADGNQCLGCGEGCLTCSGADKCLIYTDGSTSEPFMQKNLIGMILLILIIVAVLLLAFWKLVLERKFMKKSDSEENSSLKDRIMADSQADQTTTNINFPNKSIFQSSRKEKDAEVFPESHTFTTLKCNTKEDGIEPEDGFKEISSGWIEALNEENPGEGLELPVKKRGARRKRPQLVTSPSAIQVKENHKDEVDEYYGGINMAKNSDL